MKFKIHTLGCKVNQYESQAIRENLTGAGYEEVSKSKADIYIVNTCAVTSQSESKSRQVISKFKEENKEALIAVIGCYSQLEEEEIKSLGADIILGTKDRDRLVDLIGEVRENSTGISLVKKHNKGLSLDKLDIKGHQGHTRVHIKAQDGCDRFCSYCIIPYARGPIRSRDKDSILEEVEIIVGEGYKEIVLTGIHLASYGRDIARPGMLIELIEEVSKVQGLERIRLSSLDPNIINEDFVERLSRISKFCEHFHLSLQSGSNRVLKKMNRRYSREDYLEKIEIIKEYFFNPGLTTDIIVGFPGESDQDFADTIDLVKEVKFSRVHVFRYSPRKGTPAAKDRNQVKGPVKKERSKILRNLADSITADVEMSLIGEELSVLIEERDGDCWKGYSKNYHEIRVKSEENLENSIKTVIIDRKDDKGLVGNLV